MENVKVHFMLVTVKNRENKNADWKLNEAIIEKAFRREIFSVKFNDSSGLLRIL
jgi:hypothetical protein